MDNKKYIEVFPNKILLKKQLGASFFESKLILTNLIDKYVLFKVYINKSSQYSANPSTGYIKPGDNININIKRVEKDILNDNSKAKFLIVAFPSNKVIHDNEEAKDIIKTSDIKAESNQEIYLEAEMDSEVVLDGRKSMYVKPTNVDETLNNMYSSATDSNITIDENPFSKNPANEVEEISKQIEEMKRSIQSYESENGKLNTILTNYASNSALFKTKNRVLSKDDGSSVSSSDKFPLSLVVFMMTIGLVIGSFLNKMF